jgi:hypothetical protein
MKSKGCVSSFSKLKCPRTLKLGISWTLPIVVGHRVGQKSDQCASVSVNVSSNDRWLGNK